MKLNQPLTATFDLQTQTLTISGVNSFGKSGKVEIEVPDQSSFFSMVAAAFQEPTMTGAGGGSGLLADGLAFGMHLSGGQHLLSFTFNCGDIKLSFVVPIVANAPERLSAIQGHLEQALSEMGYSGPLSKQ